ncbi:Clavaminate synthase-like protein [Hypoxylon sp. FL0543]|nr:Clavaminate synthase-like protein [Hypoxylon sp. FL0543]
MLLRLKRGSRPASVFCMYRGSGVQSRFQSTFSTTPSHIQHNKQQAPTVETVTGDISTELFRKIAWIPETPLLLQASQGFPAIQKWFQYDKGNTRAGFSQYLKAYEAFFVPYEFTIAQVSPSGGLFAEHDVLVAYLRWLHESPEYKTSPLPAVVETIIQELSAATQRDGAPLTFHQFHAYLGLIISACEFNRARIEPAETIKSLYVAQCDLSLLPERLRHDLPVPDVVIRAGKGDIYNSSIWLGLQPTYTPLHRDPNPNLFCQLASTKRIRLVTPSQGDLIYARVRRELGSNGNSRFRGAEMMGGRERELLHHAVWDDDSVPEVLLDSGDALFIPKGWWHSVASNGREGELNASVNWWFR